MVSGAKCAVPSSQQAASPGAAVTAARAAAPTLDPRSAFPAPLLMPKNPPLRAMRALYLAVKSKKNTVCIAGGTVAVACPSKGFIAIA